MQNTPNTKEHPISFSSSSVQALLADHKTQTRRIIRTQLDREFLSVPPEEMHCPYGQEGNLLWVREGIRRHFPLGATYTSDLTPVMGKGPTGSSLYGRAQVTWLWKRNYLAARFMPRWASRIMLEIIRVRVERLQDISEADAKAEGVAQNWIGDTIPPEYENEYQNYAELDYAGFPCNSARESYQTLWDRINKKRGFPWASNPFVWVIEFKKLADIL